MMSTSSPSGAFFAASFSMSSKSFRPEAARVFERARRNGVHANASRPEFVGQVAAGSLQRRLDRPHDVVVRHDAIGAVIAHREHRAAFGHQRRRELRHSDEGMAGHVHRLGEAFGRTVEKPDLKVLLRRKGDRMHENVEPSPCVLNLLEHRLQLSRNGNVDCAGDRGPEFLRQRLDKASEPFRSARRPRDQRRGSETPWRSRRRSNVHWRCRRRAPFRPPAPGASVRRSCSIASSNEWARPPPCAAPPPP